MASWTRRRDALGDAQRKLVVLVAGAHVLEHVERAQQGCNLVDLRVAEDEGVSAARDRAIKRFRSVELDGLLDRGDHIVVKEGRRVGCLDQGRRVEEPLAPEGRVDRAVLGADDLLDQGG
jgi:hypothetical protein